MAGALSAGTADRDGDGIVDGADNCRSVANADQVDTDRDGVGDACDECPGTVVDVPGRAPEATPAADQFGCSAAEACPCLGPRTKLRTWSGRLEYLRCVQGKTRRLERLDRVTRSERRKLAARLRGAACGTIQSLPNDRDGDGVLDDGDGNGVRWDAPCTGGATTGCDDNCPRTRNPGQRNTDGKGWGDACDIDADDDGVFNWRDNCPRKRNADQKDGDGVGDVCDRCPDSDPQDDVNDHGCD
ncbi:MAG: thrombospondin type 3 repeat-containing protein [bacterium]|nr:thrombospondin type 3 repeat-containing protein [bacterium]